MSEELTVIGESDVITPASLATRQTTENNEDLKTLFSEMQEEEGVASDTEGEEKQAWFEDYEEQSELDEEDDDDVDTDNETDTEEERQQTESVFTERQAVDAFKDGFHIVEDADGNIVKIPRKGTLYKKIDDQWQKVNVDEIINNGAGEVSYNKKYNQLQSRVQFADQVQTVFAKVNESLEKGDIFGVIQTIANSQDKPTGDVLKNLLQSANAHSREIAQKIGVDPTTGKVSQERLDAYIAKLNSESYKEKLESRDKAQQSQQSMVEWEAQAQKRLQEEGIPQELLQFTIESVVESGEEVPEDPDSKFNYVLEKALFYKKGVHVRKVLNEINPKLWGNNEVRNTLLDMVDLRKHNEDKIREFANVVIGTTKEKLAKKLSPNGTKPTKQPSQYTKRNEIKVLSPTDDIF